MDADARHPRRIRRAVILLVLGAVVAASLSGCFSVLHAAQDIVAPDQAMPTATSPSPRATSAPAAALVSIAPGTVAAVGAIRSPARAYFGRISVVATSDGGYAVDIVDNRLPEGRDLVAALASREVASDSTCDRRPETDALLPALGAVGRKPSISFALASDETHFWRNDPTFITNVLFLDPHGSSPGCLSAIAANARLTWNLPDMNPGFRIVDSGARPGASGATTGNFHQLIGYTVAQGDSLDGIARRFEISVDDLQWLNPNRTHDQEAEFGETLNLGRYLR